MGVLPTGDVDDGSGKGQDDRRGLRRGALTHAKLAKAGRAPPRDALEIRRGLFGISAHPKIERHPRDDGSDQSATRKAN